MTNNKNGGSPPALSMKKLLANAVLLVVGIVLVSLFFYYEDLFLSDYHQAVISMSCLAGWLFVCSCTLVVSCLGLLGSVWRAWRSGKWSEYGLTIAVWVAAVAFAWFVMDVPGLWRRLMEYT